jgi:hypothetical protein
MGDEIKLTNAELFDAWKQYESIAMHFNELIARFRIQALGGTATIGAVAVALTPKDHSPWVFVGVLAFLAAAWTAIWQLDYGYYNKLLHGCVVAVTEIEKQLPLKLSTRIEQQFPRKPHGHFWFYSLIQAALLALLGAVAYAPWAAGHHKFRYILIALVLWLVATVVVALWPSCSTKATPPASAT